MMASDGKYGNRSEYIRELVRRDQRERTKERLRELIAQGLSSGTAVPMTKAPEKRMFASRNARISERAFECSASLAGCQAISSTRQPPTPLRPRRTRVRALGYRSRRAA